MISSKEYLQKCVIGHASGLIISIAVVCIYMADFFIKYTAYAPLGAVAVFIAVRMTTSPIHAEAMRAVRFPERRWRGAEAIPFVLTIISLFAKLNGFDLPLYFLLPIQLGGRLAELRNISSE